MLGCSSGDPVPVSGADSTNNCDGSCADASSFLTTAEVGQVISQAVFEAQAQGVAATIAVSDRVGNVLGVYQMTGANPSGVTVTSTPDGINPISGGLEGLIVPSGGDVAVAIAKAITGAYLSSEGNAFSSRTAGQIVQEHFNPGEDNQPGGPLFGVQFSQLACSDIIVADAGGASGIGPKRSPLGLSADPGGFPLYKNGTVVGGVGVIADGFYTLDKNLLDVDRDMDELIALAATFGFGAPVDRRSNRITVEGKTLRFSDVTDADLLSDPSSAPSFGSLGVGVGSLAAVPTYFDGTLRDGTAFGTAASGIRAATADFDDLDGFILVDGADANRFAPTASAGGPTALTQAEVTQLMRSSLEIANRARAQIRRPLGTPARVTISVVDADGEILGIVRGRDAPIFGIDVSLQKARTAAFFSSSAAAGIISTLPLAEYLDPNLAVPTLAATIDLDEYVTALRSFLGLPSALSDGAIAFTDRAGGNLSRPFYPDGIQANIEGPLSKPAGEWSPFSTGFQLDLVINAIELHVAFLLGLVPDVTTGCAGKSISGVPVATSNLLANGLQIFPGSVPIYRGNELVGAIGVSGDGVDQDDMIAFLGLHNAGLELGGSINNAPVAIRADNLEPQGERLRYVQCPQAPFIDDDSVDVCSGK